MSLKIPYSLLIILFLLTTPGSFAVAAENASPNKKITITVNKYTETVDSNTYASWLTHDLSTVINPAYHSEIENAAHCPTANGLFCTLFLSERKKLHFQAKSVSVFNQEAAKSYLTSLAGRSDTETVDAKFKIENGSIANFTPEKQGIKLDQEKALAVLADFFKQASAISQEQKIELPYQTQEPRVSTSEVNNMGITTLIGEGKSNFKGSPGNRIHNIKAALKRFDGALIKPGEEFSFVNTLGEVDDAHGYLPELVIKRGKTEPEFGGGICQVSTTVFRAAIYSGLEITARRNHAYPVSYYNPQGMDSTIYIPKPDLRFKNNTPGYILIQPSIVGTELTIAFYGTDDGRKIEIDGPRITESNPDRSIKTTFTQKVTAANGSVLINDTFNSFYESPYKYPHPGDAMLAQKPANWTDDEWKSYKQTFKDMAKAAAKSNVKP